MSKPFSPKVVTANALLEGDVVYQSENGWTRSLAEAETLTDEAIADLRMIDAARQVSLVVGVYLADVDNTKRAPVPVHFREAFRAKGPSNYAHGKQEKL